MEIEENGREVAAGRDGCIRYQVLASRIPGIFSLGGDLLHFSKLIEARDREGLIRYGIDCVDLVYWTSVGYNLPVTTIALVQGTAQGGGFEAALAAHVIVAERQCRFGFPEVMFNLFPGMGGGYPGRARRGRERGAQVHQAARPAHSWHYRDPARVAFGDARRA